MEIMQKNLRTPDPIWASIFIICLLWFVAGSVIAQPAESPTPDELFNSGLHVINDWRSLGALAGSIAAVKFVVDLTRVSAVSRWIDGKDGTSGRKWIRPVLAVISASLIGASAALTEGANVPLAIGHAIFVGMGSIGFHELVDKFIYKYNQGGK
jgi:hypothetical protein